MIGKLKIIVQNDEFYIKNLDILRYAVRGESGILKKVWAAGLMAASKIFYNIFKEKGARFNWPDLHVWTKVLRPNLGRTFTSMEEIESAQIPILVAIGTGRNSLIPGRGSRNNLFKVTNKGGEVGSTLPYFITHDQERSGPRTSKFKFDAKRQKTFNQNMAKTSGGEHNSDYYFLKNQMIKADGKNFTKPRRQVTPDNNDIKPGEMNDIIGDMDKETSVQIDKLGLY